MSKGGTTIILSLRLLLIVALLGVVAPEARAAAPQTISFQGRVLSKDRTRAPTGNYPFRFSLYTAASGGSAAWQESWSGSGLSVRYGLFNVELGTLNPLTGLDWSNNSYWLGIEFDSDSNGSFDQVFSGRVPLGAAPFALAAQTITDTLPVSKGGTGATVAASALNNLLPGQSGQSGKALVSDGTNAGWQTMINGVNDASYLTLSASDGLSSERVLQGTANQVILTDNGSGAILSLPQDIATTSNVNFGNLALPSNGQLTFGTDTNLYRSATNQLSTDDNLLVNSNVTARQLFLDSTATGGTTFRITSTSTGSTFGGIFAGAGKYGIYSPSNSTVYFWIDPTTNLTTINSSLAVTGTSLDLQGRGDLRLYDTDSSNYVGFQSPATVSSNVLWTLPGTDGTSGQCLATNSTGTLSWSDCAGGSGAPTTASYLTLGVDGTLSAERVLAGTANQIIVTDNGANSTVVLSTPQSIATSSSPTFAGLALGTGSITMTGSIGTTGARLTKGWFTDLEVTNAILGSITGNAATVTTNANLTGPITSVGNTTSVASQTGTGSTFVMQASPTLTTPNIGVATATSIGIGANTLDTTEWANLDGLNQTLATTSSPTFANITDSGLTATRVTFAGTAGLLQDSASMTFDTTNGLKLAAGSTSALQLSSTAGTAAGGLLFGVDTNLYRSAANTLKTDDAFIVDVGATSTNNITSFDADTALVLTGTGNTAISTYSTRTTSNIGALRFYGNNDAVSAEVIQYGLINGSIVSGTDGAETGSISLYTANSASAAGRYGKVTFDENGKLWFSDVAGIGGHTTDTNLYRGAANELTTDDLLSFSSAKANTATDFKTYKTDGVGGMAFIFDTSATYTSGSLLSIRNNGSPRLSLSATGNLVISGTIEQSSTPADLAENIAVSDNSSAGDIVATDSNRNETARKATVADQRALGVISTEPGILISGGTKGKPLALAGRVPVKVKADAAIKRGDLVVLSDVPGLGTKAGDSAAASVGVALTNQTGNNRVTIQLNPGYYLPSFGNTQTVSALSPQQSGVLDAISLLADGTLQIESLAVSKLTVNHDLIVNGGLTLPALESASGQITAGESAVFVSTTRVKDTDRVLITTINEPAAPGANVSRGQIKPGEGFWVHLNSAQPATIKFDWLLIH